MLYNLACVADLPLPDPVPSNKRPREESISDATSPDQDVETAVEELVNLRPIAGSKRVHAYQQQHPEPPTPPNAQDSNQDFVLPVHSADLGRLPLHSVFAPDFNTNGWYAPPQAGVHGQAPILPGPVLHMGNGALHNMLNEAFGVQNPAGIHGSNVPSLGVDIAPPQVPSIFTPMVPPSGVHDNSIENMMASVSMEPAMIPDLPENDTLAMWSNAPPGFE